MAYSGRGEEEKERWPPNGRKEAKHVRNTVALETEIAKFLFSRFSLFNAPALKEDLPYLFLSSIHEKAMYRYVLDGKSALAWEIEFTCIMGSLGPFRVNKVTLFLLVENNRTSVEKTIGIF